VHGIDGQKLEAARKIEAEKRSPTQLAAIDSDLKGNRRTLKADSFIPATMAAIYLLLFLYFRAIGGYKPVHIVPVAEQQAAELKAAT